MFFIKLLIGNIYYYLLLSHGNDSLNLFKWQEIINIYNLYPGWYSDINLLISMEFLLVSMIILYKKINEC